MHAIPTFVVEEHHEAFLVWTYARSNSMLPQTGSTLLHVDEHADMGTPRLTTPLGVLNGDLTKTEQFVYNELAISEVLVPAMYSGIFDSVCWLMQKEIPKVKQSIWVYSHAGEGKVLRLAASKPDGAGDAHSVIYAAQGVNDSFTTGAALVLDIDLDYFSCDQAENRVERVEITEGEYRRFHEDRYHFVRLNQGNRIQARDEAGRYYLYLRNYEDDVPCPLKVSQATILERIDAFARFLSDNRVKPALIDIARSRISGFTPRDQWHFIEEHLLVRLAALYNLQHKAIQAIGVTA